MPDRRPLRAALCAAAATLALPLAVSLAPASTIAEAAASPLDQSASRFAALAPLSGDIATMATRSAISIAQAVDAAAAVTHQGVVESAASYGALAAAQDPDFRASVEAAAAREGREPLISRLLADPAQVRQLADATAGAQAAGEALHLVLAGIDEAADITHDASYSLQRTGWARQRSDATARVVAVTQASARPWQAGAFTRTAIPLPQGDSSSGGVPVSDRVLAAGALAVLGADRAAQDLTRSRSGDSCLRRAHLTLRMCLAAAGFPYEQSFCLSRHALADTASCVRSGVR
jgi:hypothetical protein